MSRTYAILEVDPDLVDQVASALNAAGGYDHAFMDEGEIDMDGLAIRARSGDLVDLHPGIAHLLQYFAWEHLPPHLADVSRPFGRLARQMAGSLPSNPELTAGLRKLLEAKDCAVRARLAK